MNPEAGARTGAAMLLIVSPCLLDARARRASVASGHHYTCVSAADAARSSRARLQREYIEATKAMQRLAARMERTGMLRSAA